uniref:Uncharacterized protein n=1 Tax=Clytia hemisphaerica TaxID=252671 RepID=A0A7M5XMF9_9CNID
MKNHFDKTILYNFFIFTESILYYLYFPLETVDVPNPRDGEGEEGGGTIQMLEDVEDSDADSDDWNSDADEPKQKARKRNAKRNRRTSAQQKSTRTKDLDADSDDSVSDADEPKWNQKKPAKQTKRKASKGKTWSNDEKEAVRRRLKDFFKLKKVPRQGDIQPWLKDEPALKNRDWKAVKFHVNWAIIAEKRQLAKQNTKKR